MKPMPEEWVAPVQWAAAIVLLLGGIFHGELFTALMGPLLIYSLYDWD